MTKLTPAAKVASAFMLGVVTAMFVILTYQEFIKSIIKVTSMKGFEVRIEIHSYLLY